MNIVRRGNAPLANQFRPMPIEDQIGRIVENMFEDFLSPYSSVARLDAEGAISPRLNLTETDKSFEVEVELPGASKDDIKVAIDNRRVTIEAEEKREDKKEGENLIYAERLVRKFSRTFTLPTDVDDAAAQARFENGILHLTLPKKGAASAKKLTVQ
jgi:HSP20 family protein